MGNSSGIIRIGHSHELEVRSGGCWEVTMQILNPEYERLPVVNKQVTFRVQNQTCFPVLGFTLLLLRTAKFKKVIGKNRE